MPGLRAAVESGARLTFCLAGARQVATGLNTPKQSGGNVFVTSMCVDSEMGMAAIFISEHY